MKGCAAEDDVADGGLGPSDGPLLGLDSVAVAAEIAWADCEEELLR